MISHCRSLAKDELLHMQLSRNQNSDSGGRTKRRRRCRRKCQTSTQIRRALVFLSVTRHSARPPWLRWRLTTALSIQFSPSSFCGYQRHAGQSLNPLHHVRILCSPYPISLQSYRSQPPSLELDGDDGHLLKSSPSFHSEPTNTGIDKVFIKSFKDLRQRLKGWRFGVLLSSGLASFVLVTNCVAAIAIHSKYGIHDGVSTAFEGDCDVVNRWSLGLHVIINMLSSLLLSASNYTMQVLNAPTRSECDKVHAQNKWLDIGITSLHNLTRITWPRRVLWLLLGFSSVPIHLFYNSAAFKTIDANTYRIVAATPLFLESDAFQQLPSVESKYTYRSDGRVEDPAEVLRQMYQSRKLDFANLTTAECLDAYSVDFMTGHSDVIVVLSGPYPANASTGAVMVSTPKLSSSASKGYGWYVSPAWRMVAQCHVSATMETKLFPPNLSYSSSNADQFIGSALRRYV